MAGKNDQSKDRDLSPVEPAPRKEEWGIELGVETNLPFATAYNDGLSTREKERRELRELLRSNDEDYGPSVAQLSAMRRLDGQARALYRLLTLPIRAALSKSTFVPADGGEAEAEFINHQFTLPPSSGGMSVTFHKFMAQLLQGLFDGFSPFEQVYDYAKYGPLKGKYVLRKLAYRQPSTITVIEDDKGHFQGFRQRAYRNGEVIDIHIPRERAFYFAAQEEERKYYGVSFFQSAFYHYDKKIKMYYVAHLAAQRAAVGTRVGITPSNATEQQRRVFSQNLSNLAVAQWMMVPENFKVEMLKEGGSFQFLDYINHHNNQMSKSILANFFDQDTGGGAGDSKLVAFGQPGNDMFVLMLRAIMDDIASSINHYIIPKLIDWNFEGGRYPTFQWAELTDEQKAVIGETFDKLATAGDSVTVTPEFVREIEKKMADEMGLEIDWDEVEEREEAEAEAFKLQQDLLAGAPTGDPLAGPDAMIADFEAQAAAVGADVEEEVPTAPVALSREEELLTMAEDLLELARPVSGDRRVVRTPEGEARFGVPIGQPIPTGQGEGEPAEKQVTVERLMSLKMQYEGAKQAGNEALATKLLRQLHRAVYDRTGSWSPSTFMRTLSSLPTPKRPNQKD